MKKILVLTLTVLTITVLVGCGAKNNKVQEEKNDPTLEEQSENIVLLGKVEKVVGNEISMKLTDDNLQFVPGEGGNVELESFELSDEQLKALESGETIELGDGLGVVGMAIESGDSVDEGLEMNSFDGEVTEFVTGIDAETGNEVDPFSEIEFNGESKDLTIPAGVEIVNMVTGKEGKISDIKDGSVLSIIMDSKTNTVTRIEIMG